MLAKLRGRTAELRIETGRWFGLNRDEWIGKNCDKGALADVEHILLRCVCGQGRVEMERLVNEVVEGWQARYILKVMRRSYGWLARRVKTVVCEGP